VVATGRPAVSEKQAALAVALQLTEQLRATGFRVVLSRATDTSVAALSDADVQSGTLRPTAVRKDLLARIACANASQASALVSIHFNAYTDPSIRGTQTVYDGARPFAGESLRLARSLQSALVARLRLKDKGVVPDDQLDAPALTENGQNYGHLLLLGPAQPGVLDQPTTMPGALVEPLFLPSPAEAEVAGSPNGQRELARALAEGLQAFLLKGGGAR
jgi:N-acetylmuramoyl-L-alanine amidase